MAYTPIGLSLLIIRLLISVILWILASALPDCPAVRTILNHGLALVFGVFVRVEGQVQDEGKNQDDRSRIVVANSVSALDHFALRRVGETVAPSVWDIPSALSNAMGLETMNTNGRDALVASIKKCLGTSERCRVVVQPEFGATNNGVALLKFNAWPFGIQHSVQPVAIRAHRPGIVDLKVTSLASTWWSDVLCFLFVPYTVFTLTYLKVKRNADQEVLAREVEADIARCLGISVSKYSILDKKEYEKRYFAEKMRAGAIANRQFQNLGPAGASPELMGMARQVSEVMPLVPRSVILEDLRKSRGV